MKYLLRSRIDEYQNMIPRFLKAYYAFEEEPKLNAILDKTVKTITFQVTEDCNLCCTYCYQINKKKTIMSFDTAKAFIDLLIEDSYKENTYVSLNSTYAIICEFIGGEPLLEIDLIDQITDYFRCRLIELKHPWAPFFKISMISNGVLYFSENVQNYLDKNKGIISFGISLDGCKELHDACRIFPTGEGSYDIAVAGCKHYMNTYDSNMSTKMTFAPENLEYAYKAVKNLIELGYKTIHCNPIYEDKWSEEHPRIYYEQLKQIADYFIENKLYNDVFVAIFDKSLCGAVDCENDNKNYCGTTGSMLSLDYKGDIYPCIRFMPSSLGEDVPAFKIGDIYNGINNLPDHRDKVNLLDSITYVSQSDNECLSCPISSGCGWCTAYNYQATGTPNKRIKSICGMHKARILANVYYWNKVFEDGNFDDEPYPMLVPKEWALNIISEEEYNMLLDLANHK